MQKKKLKKKQAAQSLIPITTNVHF